MLEVSDFSLKGWVRLSEHHGSFRLSILGFQIRLFTLGPVILSWSVSWMDALLDTSAHRDPEAQSLVVYTGLSATPSTYPLGPGTVVRSEALPGRRECPSCVASEKVRG